MTNDEHEIYAESVEGPPILLSRGGSRMLRGLMLGMKKIFWFVQKCIQTRKQS